MSQVKKVIAARPQAWTLLAFVTPQGKNIYDHWDAGQTSAAEEMLEAALKGDRKTDDYRNWVLWRHRMTGKAGDSGVVELGFKCDKRQLRVLCMFKGTKTIVLLCICYHKGAVWTPAESVASAIERAKLVNAGKAVLHEIKDRTDL